MSTLHNQQVEDTLNVLHQKASVDSVHRHQQRQQAAAKGETFAHAWSTAYMAVNKEEGQLLYFLATLRKATNIVEFGCSFGISTIYLAAAARDNGGRVLTTDLEPAKVSGTLENLRAAGLDDLVEVRLAHIPAVQASIKQAAVVLKAALVK